MQTLDHVLLIHPKRSLLRYGFVTFAVTTIPLFSVLYWYTAAAGTWWQMASIHFLLASLCMLAYWRQRSVYSSIDADTLGGNGIFSGVTRVPLTEVSTVVLASVYPAHSLETITQLVVIDTNGTCRHRMRGQFWHDSDLRAFAKASGADVVTDCTPLTAKEFFDKYPASRYWFEGNLVLSLAFAVAVVTATGVIAAWLMTVMGFS